MLREAVFADSAEGAYKIFRNVFLLGAGCVSAFLVAFFAVDPAANIAYISYLKIPKNIIFAGLKNTLCLIWIINL